MTTYDQIASIDAQIAQLQEQRASILQEWADEHCPFKVGDVVADGRRTRRIDRIDAICFAGMLLWMAWGYFVRPDGTTTGNHMSLGQYEYERQTDRFRRIEPTEKGE